MTVTIIDYGVGNLASVRKAFAAVGAGTRFARSPVDLDDAGAIALPGVGHFDATSSLNDAWRDAVRRRVDAGAAVLGICLGMQWLCEGSDESPGASGLGLFGGRCFRLSGDVKVPHVGWNTLEDVAPRSRLLEGLPPGPWMYFTHAFAAPVTTDAVAVTTHGVAFAAVVERGRVFGLQSHPEKSGRAGLRVLANFVAAAREVRC